MGGCQTDSGSVCRACLTARPRAWSQLAAHQYTFCTALMIPENDQLPKILCLKCSNLLDKFYCFKKQCILSEQTLRYSIENDNIFTKHEIEVHIKSDTLLPDIEANNHKSNIITDNTDIHEDIAFPDPVLPQTHKDSTNEDKDSDCDYKQAAFDDELIGDQKDICKIVLCGSDNLSQNIDNSITENSKTICDAEHDKAIDDKLSEKIRTIGKIKLKKRKSKGDVDFKMLKNKKYLNDRKNSNLDYPCLLCNKKFAYPERLEAHNSTHTGVKEEITCDICDKKFKQWDGLRRHREFVHMTPERLLECPTCGKLYKTSMTLHNHQKIHQPRKDYVCHICGGRYRSAAGLQNHLDTHMENRERTHECKICDKKFVSKSYLKSHMFRHRERRFVCHKCRFPFFTKTDLTRHMLTHNGVKPFTCEICSKSYSTKSFLIEHGRIHSGERPFSCDYCSMNFISKRRLIDHRRTHTGEKPHKCDKCNHAFIQRGSLTRHLKTHDK